MSLIFIIADNIRIIKQFHSVRFIICREITLKPIVLESSNLRECRKADKKYIRHL
jgi:hypothetical protein